MGGISRQAAAASGVKARRRVWGGITSDPRRRERGGGAWGSARTGSIKAWFPCGGMEEPQGSRREGICRNSKPREEGLPCCWRERGRSSLLKG